MSAWKELPRPASPGPWMAHEPVGGFNSNWEVRNVQGPEHDPEDETVCTIEPNQFEQQDAAAIAALPEYVAEVERLRAWVDGGHVGPNTADRIRSGAWPDGRTA